MVHEKYKHIVLNPAYILFVTLFQRESTVEFVVQTMQSQSLILVSCIVDADRKALGRDFLPKFFYPAGIIR